jgi:hypothetical protein
LWHRCSRPSSPERTTGLSPQPMKDGRISSIDASKYGGNGGKRHMLEMISAACGKYWRCASINPERVKNVDAP